MTDQNQTPVPGGSTPPPPVGDWREQRRAERQARREARWARRGRRSFWWLGGAILIVIGLALFLQNMGIPFLQNWWALFILIPAFWSFVAAWDAYQEGQGMTRRLVGSLVSGTILTLVALGFLFNLDFGMYWPIVLIVAGVGLLIPAFLRK